MQKVLRMSVSKEEQLTEEERRLRRYKKKRFKLFFKFNEGIEMDEESWYSVTPELLSRHIALKFYYANDGRPQVILDAFCGVGGNTIQFAIHSHHSSVVIATDIDPEKIRMAANNARIYNVRNKIEFIIGDFIRLHKKFAAQSVFLSPPWGGPNYHSNKKFDVETNLQPVSYKELLTLTKSITPNFAIYLPRNVDPLQLVSLHEYGQTLEIENNYCEKKLNSITVYLGNLITDTHKGPIYITKS